MVVRNHFSLSMTKKSFYFIFVFGRYFGRYLGQKPWHGFFFQCFKTCCSTLLTCIVPDEKSAVILIFVSLYTVCLTFSLVAFTLFSVFGLVQFHSDLSGLILFILLGFQMDFHHVRVVTFYQFRKNSQPFLFNNHLTLPFTLTCAWNTNLMNVTTSLYAVQSVFFNINLLAELLISVNFCNQKFCFCFFPNFPGHVSETLMSYSYFQSSHFCKHVNQT